MVWRLVKDLDLPEFWPYGRLKGLKLKMKHKKITYFRHYIPWTKIPDDMNKFILKVWHFRKGFLPQRISFYKKLKQTGRPFHGHKSNTFYQISRHLIKTLSFLFNPNLTWYISTGDIISLLNNYIVQEI